MVPYHDSHAPRSLNTLGSENGDAEHQFKQALAQSGAELKWTRTHCPGMHSHEPSVRVLP